MPQIPSNASAGAAPRTMRPARVGIGLALGLGLTALLGACGGGSSGRAGIGPAPVVPATPTALSAAAGNGKVTLQWSASAGATGYTVGRASSAAGPYTTLAADTQSPYSATGLRNGTSYYFAVSAANAAGRSPPSAPVEATPLAPAVVPGAPQGLTATPASGEVVLSWTAASGATGYTIGRATASGGPYTNFRSSAPNYTDTTVTNGVTYYYVVAGLDSAGSGANCAEVSATPEPTGAYLPAQVSVVHTPVATVGTTFTGLSYEKSKLSQSVLSASDVPLVAFMELIGPSVIRIGGNTVDETTYDPTGPGNTSGYVAPADIARLAGLLGKTGWKVIYGMNYVSNTPALMAEEASYAAAQFGPSLLGFEIGNEPDLYHDRTTPTNMSAFTFANFTSGWNAYEAAIAAAVPGAPFTGPATSYNLPVYTTPFASQEAARIGLLTHHYYTGNGALASSTMAKLLAGDPKLVPMLNTLATAASANHISGGYRLAEANSLYNGGSAGVSNAYGSALWMVDFLFTGALNGARGVNLHGGGTGPYTPITDNNNNLATGARSEYYGVYLFSQAARGTLVSTTTSVAGLNFSSYAVDRSDGTTAVVLNNKDPATAAVVTVKLNRPATSASTLSLTGTGLNSTGTTSTMLNGTFFGSDGSFVPGPAPSVPVWGENEVTLTVGPASAVLLSVQ